MGIAVEESSDVIIKYLMMQLVAITRPYPNNKNGIPPL